MSVPVMLICCLINMPTREFFLIFPFILTIIEDYLQQAAGNALAVAVQHSLPREIMFAFI
jgi:hypothetical protein